MQENRIGTDHALFYLAKAVVHENTGNFSAAAATFEEGVTRGARPSDRLTQGQRDFERRMVRRLQKSQDTASNATDENGGLERAACQRLSRRSAQSSRRPSRRRACGGPSSNPFQTMARQRSTSQAPNFQVFTDPAVTAAGPVASIQQLPPANNCASWAELAPHQQRHKENTGMPTPWTGCAVKQRQAAAAPEPPASFAIFDENVQPPRSARAMLGSGLREQVDAIRKCSTAVDAEADADCPVDNVTRSNPNNETAEPTPSLDQQFGFASPTINTAAAVGEVLEMFGGNLVAANACGEDYARVPSPRCSSIDPLKPASESIFCGEYAAARHAPHEQSSGQQSHVQQTGIPNCCARPQTISTGELATAADLEEPTMTIQTREARDMVLGMFSSPVANKSDTKEAQFAGTQAIAWPSCIAQASWQLYCGTERDHVQDSVVNLKRLLDSQYLKTASR